MTRRSQAFAVLFLISTLSSCGSMEETNAPSSSPDAPPAPTTVVTNHPGALEPGDDTLDSGEFADYLPLEGRRGEYVLLDLKSSALDPYLILTTPSGEQFENDDHEGDAHRSLLGMNLPEDGEYEVVVTTYAEGEAGAYDLSITRQAVPPATDKATTWVETGELADGDFTLDSGEFVDPFEFEGFPGQQVRLDLSSDMFDTYLMLVDPAGRQLENDDADDQPTHSVIEADLEEAGTYEILVTSYEPDTGDYRLAVEIGGSRSTAERDHDVTLAFGARQWGSLSAGDTRLEGGEFLDRYVFEAAAGQPVVVEMRSEEIDTFLMLQMPDGTSITNDDYLDNTETSRIELTLPQAGRYRVGATSYEAGETGNYELSLRGEPSAPGRPRRGSPAADNVFALLIGISDYEGKELDLPFTAEDAVRIRDALTGIGMRPANSVLLTDRQATLGNMRSAMNQLSTRMGPSDLFVFFFSGHGDRIPRSGPQPADPDAFDESLSFYDGELLDDELASLLDGVSSRTLLVLDSCFSGGFAKDVISAPERMGLFSSEEDVTSSVADKFRAGGYLSVFLAEAIAGTDADDGDGNLTALELSQYIYERYRNDVKSKGEGDFVRTGGPQLGYQHLVVDRGSVGPFETLFRVGGR